MAYTVIDSKNIDKKKNIYTFGGSGTKPERDDIAENSKLIDYSSGQKFYYDPTKAAGNKWQPDKEPSGGSGGSLPANFPTESAANANKYVGFDENGDYTAKEGGGGGGGGGQCIVTFSGADIEAGTVDSADKTLEQIAEAIAAGKPVVGFVSSEDTGDIWMPLINAVVDDDKAFYQFGAPIGNSTFAITYGNDGGEPQIEFQVIELINRNDVLENTSLIVNLTIDGTGETPVLRGSSTYNDIVTARMTGKNVLFNYTGSEGSSSSSLIDCIVESDGITVYLCSAGEIAMVKGNSTDYFALNIG